jgi:hypothetical protein
MRERHKYLSAVLSEGTCRIQKKNEYPLKPPPADGWIIFMKINILCCNFNENWTFAPPPPPFLGGCDVPLVHVWLCQVADKVRQVMTLIITQRAGLRVTIKGKTYISACRRAHEHLHFTKAEPISAPAKWNNQLERINCFVRYINTVKRSNKFWKFVLLTQ